MGLLAEVGARLLAAGVAGTSGTATGSVWPLRYRGLPPTPSRCVAVTLSGGFAPEGKAPLDRPTFQVLVRGSTSDGVTLEQKVEAVSTALHARSTAFTTWTWVDVQRQGDALWLGWDDGQRPMYSVNFAALRSRTS